MWGCRILFRNGWKGVNSLRFPGEKWQEVELLCTILPKAWILLCTCKKTVFAKYLWVSEQGGLSRWYPYTTVHPFYCPVFRKGLFSISRSDRTTPLDMPPSCRFLMSCIKLVWIVQFLHVYVRNHICFAAFFCAVLYGKWTILHPKKTILHPILHPKLPVKAGCLRYGCRKCRFFFQKLFSERRDTTVRELQNIGLLWAKVRMFCIESTDVCLKEVRCFCFPIRWKAWNTDFADLAEENRFYVLPLNHLQQHMGKTSGKLQYFS